MYREPRASSNGARGNVLVLNRVYQAIHVTGVFRAFRLFYADRARAVDGDFRTYTFDHWCRLPANPETDVIRTPSRVIRIPRVIQLVRYDRLPRVEMRFSRRNVFRRDRHRCQYCGRVFPERLLNLDHVVPISRGGTSTWDNVVCACIECNNRKGNRIPEEANMSPLRRPKKPTGPGGFHLAWPGGRPHREWEVFLHAVQWPVELCDDASPEP